MYSEISYSVAIIYLRPIHFAFLLRWFCVCLPAKYDHHRFLLTESQSLFVTLGDTPIDRSLQTLPCGLRLIRRRYQAHKPLSFSTSWSKKFPTGSVSCLSQYRVWASQNSWVSNPRALAWKFNIFKLYSMPILVKTPQILSKISKMLWIFNDFLHFFTSILCKCICGWYIVSTVQKIKRNFFKMP